MPYNTKTQAKEMSILSIETINLEGDCATVTAVVEDALLKYPGSYYDPPEYEPALCSASFELEEGETLPTTDDELLKYINALDLDWELIIEDYYDDYS